MSVPLTSFELFPSLPIELRNQIIAAAIQPRLVEIERVNGKTSHDVAKYEAMIKLAHEQIARMDRTAMDDPPKTYTEILAPMLPGCKPELMLAWFRSKATPFKAPLDPRQPRTLTRSYKDSRNGVEWCLLDRYGVTAIELAMRSFHFRSSSTIPALLHTSRESRRTMQLCGYELAFCINDVATPRAWFNFRYDTLRMLISDVPQLPSKDLVRVERLTVERDRKVHTKLLLDILPIARQLNEVLWLLDSHRETEANLWKYLEHELPEFIRSGYVRYIRAEVWPEYEQRVLDYPGKNEGNTEKFFALEHNGMEDRFRRLRDSHFGSFTNQDQKYVFVVTKEQDVKIIAFRKRFIRGMEDVERLQEEEGPCLVSYHPFDDGGDVRYEDEGDARFPYRR